MEEKASKVKQKNGKDSKQVLLRRGKLRRKYVKKSKVICAYQMRPERSKRSQSTSMVKQISAALVMTAAMDRNWKMDSQVPMSCAPEGTGRW